MICDFAGMPSIEERPVYFKRLKPPRPRKPPRPPVAPPRKPEPNLLAMGEVDLICWETMPPPTP
jgi:hypothetical protein